MQYQRRIHESRGGLVTDVCNTCGESQIRRGAAKRLERRFRDRPATISDGQSSAVYCQIPQTSAVIVKTKVLLTSMMVNGDVLVSLRQRSTVCSCHPCRHLLFGI